MNPPSEKEILKHFKQYKCTHIKWDDTRLEIHLNDSQYVWKLKLFFSEDFPFRLPTVTLDDEITQFYPHVDWDGIICVTDHESENIILNRQAELIAEFAEDAVTTIQSSSENDFWNEYEGYFNKYCESNIAELFIDIEDYQIGVYDINITCSTQSNLPHYIYTSKTEKIGNEFSYKPYKNKTIKRGLLIVINERVEFIKHRQKYTLVDLFDFLEQIKVIKKSEWKKINKYLSAEKRDKHIVIRFPRADDGYNVIGFYSRKANINEQNLSVPLKGIYCKRVYEQFLKERIGISNDISRKKIAIIGCGSLGGNVAILLAQNGVNNFTLVDPEDFSSENIYRHVLPASALGAKNKNKAVLLASLLKQRFMNIKTKSYIGDIKGWLNADEDYFKYDLIVVAIGYPLQERWFNREIRQNEHGINVINVWQEANGLGGHIISYNTKKQGCIDCLFYRNSTEVNKPQVSFSASSEITSKSIGGCIASFTPYGSNDAYKTSALCVDTALDVLFENSLPPNYRAWKGLNRADYKTSKYYENFDGISSEIDSILTRGCPVCREAK